MIYSERLIQWSEDDLCVLQKLYREYSFSQHLSPRQQDLVKQSNGSYESSSLALFRVCDENPCAYLLATRVDEKVSDYSGISKVVVVSAYGHALWEDPLESCLWANEALEKLSERIRAQSIVWSIADSNYELMRILEKIRYSTETYYPSLEVMQLRKINSSSCI